MTAGSGHIMAAKSVLDYILSYTDARAEHIDFSKVVSPMARFSYRYFYEFLAKYAPWLWGWYYNFANKNRFIFFISEKIASIELFSNKKIIEMLKEKQPDLVIFTNPLPARILNRTIKSLFKNTKTGIVITDYHAHRVYNIKDMDYFFVSCGETKYQLIELGVDKDKIVVSGIPVNPRFFILQDVLELKEKHKIENNLPTVVFITSSLRKKVVNRTLKELHRLSGKINSIVITGGNEKLYKKIKAKYQHDNLIAVNWTDVMDEYMKIADFIVGKPGGLVSSESMAIKKPLIMVGLIPGVEPHNLRYMEKNDFGIDATDNKKYKEILEKTIFSHNFIAKENLIFQQNPAKIIVETILK